MKPGRTLALIPAKAASARLKRKNLLELAGKSLMAIAVECALAAGVFDAVVVSTEDEEIAAAARDAGGDVPFMRPAKLAIDPAGVADVTLDALERLEGLGHVYETVVILLPTSPLRTPDDVREALRIYAGSDVEMLMSVSPYDHSPLAGLTYRQDGTLEPLLPQWLPKLGAHAVPGSLPTVVRANGAITICSVARLRAERTYYAYPLAAYEMPWERSVDIDTEYDLLLARTLVERGPH